MKNSPGRRLVRRRPSPSMVVACLALTVALSGASYAAVVLPRNSVGTPQLKKSAVVSSKIAAGGVGASDLKASAVNSEKVKNGSLLGADFQAGQLPAGPAGPAGATGATGSQGPAGPTAATKASKNFAPDVILGPSSGTNVIDLDTLFAGAARLHLTFPGRVVADATVSVYNQSSLVQTIDCHIGRMNPANTAEADSGQSEWQTLTAGANTYELMPLNAAFDLPPGDYNFRVVCSQIGGSSNDTAVDDATLTVVAVAN